MTGIQSQVEEEGSGAIPGLFVISMFKVQKPRERPAVKFLSEINVPTLVLTGEHDIPDVHAHSGLIEVGIPNAKREVIQNAGHLIPLEQPEATR